MNITRLSLTLDTIAELWPCGRVLPHRATHAVWSGQQRQRHVCKQFCSVSCTALCIHYKLKTQRGGVVPWWSVSGWTLHGVDNTNSARQMDVKRHCSEISDPTSTIG